MNDLRRYLMGEALYGDDLDLAAIEQWYRDEEDAYFELAQEAKITTEYEYHALNDYYAFSLLKGRQFKTCLAMGCSDGEDVKPLAGHVDHFVALEPAEKWWRDTIGGKPAHYIKPSVKGTIPLKGGSVDLVVCLGVLHHIPNVSYVVQELGRVLAPGGLLVVREPIFSMGDWTQPRKHLTPRERGIPLAILQDILRHAGFTLKSAKTCMVPTTYKLSPLFGIKNAFSSRTFVLLDRLCSALLGWNVRYHRRNLIEKLAPTSCFIVAEKA